MSTISFRLQYIFLDPITTLRLDPLLSLKDLEISQLAHHLRPIFGLVLFPTTIPIKSESVHSEYGPSIDWEHQCSLLYYSRNSQMLFCRCNIIIIACSLHCLLRLFSICKLIWHHVPVIAWFYIRVAKSYLISTDTYFATKMTQKWLKNDPKNFFRIWII